MGNGATKEDDMWLDQFTADANHRTLRDQRDFAPSTSRTASNGKLPKKEGPTTAKAVPAPPKTTTVSPSQLTPENKESTKRFKAFTGHNTTTQPSMTSPTKAKLDTLEADIVNYSMVSGDDFLPFSTQPRNHNEVLQKDNSLVDERETSTTSSTRAPAATARRHTFPGSSMEDYTSDSNNKQQSKESSAVKLDNSQTRRRASGSAISHPLESNKKNNTGMFSLIGNEDFLPFTAIPKKSAAIAAAGGKVGAKDEEGVDVLAEEEAVTSKNNNNNAAVTQSMDIEKQFNALDKAFEHLLYSPQRESRKERKQQKPTSTTQRHAPASQPNRKTNTSTSATTRPFNSYYQSESLFYYEDKADDTTKKQKQHPFEHQQKKANTPAIAETENNNSGNHVNTDDKKKPMAKRSSSLENVGGSDTSILSPLHSNVSTPRGESSLIKRDVSASRESTDGSSIVKKKSTSGVNTRGSTDGAMTIMYDGEELNVLLRDAVETKQDMSTMNHYSSLIRHPSQVPPPATASSSSKKEKETSAEVMMSETLMDDIYKEEEEEKLRQMREKEEAQRRQQRQREEEEQKKRQQQQAQQQQQQKKAEDTNYYSSPPLPAPVYPSQTNRAIPTMNTTAGATSTSAPPNPSGFSSTATTSPGTHNTEDGHKKAQQFWKKLRPLRKRKVSFKMDD